MVNILVNNFNVDFSHQTKYSRAACNTRVWAISQWEAQLYLLLILPLLVTKQIGNPWRCLECGVWDQMMLMLRCVYARYYQSTMQSCDLKNGGNTDDKIKWNEWRHKMKLFATQAVHWVCEECRLLGGNDDPNILQTGFGRFGNLWKSRHLAIMLQSCDHK
jgi:hypothetical protein